MRQIVKTDHFSHLDRPMRRPNIVLDLMNFLKSLRSFSLLNRNYSRKKIRREFLANEKLFSVTFSRVVVSTVNVLKGPAGA